MRARITERGRALSGGQRQRLALARSLVAPLELPIGVLTALVGGPSFLALLHRERRRLT